MAYQQTFKDDDKDQQGQQPSADGQVLSSASTDTTSAPSSSSAPTAQPSRPQGSGFTNLNRYIDANQDQSKGMADRVTGKIEEQVTGLQDGAKTFQQGAKSQIDKATVKDTGVSQQLAKSPTQVSADAYKATQQGYKGPQQAAGIEGFSDLDQGFKKVDQQSKGLSDFAQRQTAAKDVFGKLDNQYTQGENLLDTFLLGTGAGGQTIKDFQQSLADRNVLSGWEDLVKGLDADIDTARQTSTQTAEAVKKALDDSLGKHSSAIQSAQSQIEQEQQLYKDLFGDDPRARMRALTKLGLTTQDVLDFERNYRGGGLEDLISGPRGLGDILSEQQQADYQALAALAGVSNPYNFNTTGNTNPLGFNRELFDYYANIDDIIAENPYGFGGLGAEIPKNTYQDMALAPANQPSYDASRLDDLTTGGLAAIADLLNAPKQRSANPFNNLNSGNRKRTGFFG